MARVGYARVSSQGQSLEVQEAQLLAAGCDKVFAEKRTGTTTEGRIALMQAIDYVRSGDIFVITRIDRLARSVIDLNEIVAKLTAKGDFSTIDIVASGPVTFAEATAGSGTATAAVAGGAAVHTITAAEKGAAPVIKASTYTIAADLTAAGYKAAALAIAATPIQSITREGASYLLPWVASGTLSSTSTSNTVVRLSNIGAAATGPVSIELLTSSAGGKIDCWVVTTDYNRPEWKPTTFWLAKDSQVVVKNVSPAPDGSVWVKTLIW